ncbi:MAG: hypothetical protein FWE95_07485 [Planctomycetaceae bacterium]|nr:hypothetical protein [Planctomycetaceae bacterium]
MYNPVCCLAATVSTAHPTEYMRLPQCVVVAAKSTKHQEGATAFFINQDKNHEGT